MAVIGSDNNQGVLTTSRIQCRLHRAGQFHRITQGGKGTVGVVAVINAPGFYHQEKSLRVIVENIDGLGGHLG